MKLFVSGSPSLDLSKPLPDTVIRAKKFLDKTQDGELFTSLQMSTAIGVGVPTLHSYTHLLEGYTGGGSRGTIRYYGKPATIAELRRQLVKKGRI